MLPYNTIDGITLHIRHTMLPVSNMDRTVDFYTCLLYTSDAADEL